MIRIVNPSFLFKEYISQLHALIEDFVTFSVPHVAECILPDCGSVQCIGAVDYNKNSLCLL